MATAETQTNSSLLALSQALAAAVEQSGSSVVAIDARPRVHTSGVVWRENVIVSTNHTIRRDEAITVTLPDGEVLPAAVAGRDPGTDLAVLRMDGGKGTPARLADAAALKAGGLVLAVGRATPQHGASASCGVISQLGAAWRTWRGGEIDRLLRPDVSVFIGFSGGALADAEGKIIGVNTTGLARGAGLTIPAATVNRVVDQLLQHGRIARPYLGVGMQPVALPEELRTELNWPAASALVLLSVERNAPADQAGLKLGDVLLALDDAPVADTDDVQAALSSRAAGQAIKATILRGGERRELSITLGERPVKNK